MKLPFWIETQLNKILKPQIVTIVETFIDGKPSKKFYGKSLVANFLQAIYSSMCNNDPSYVVSPPPYNSKTGGFRIDTGAISASLDIVNWIDLVVGAGDLTEGIVCGSAAVVPAPASFNVGTLIAQGAAAGQLQYGAMSGIQGVTIVGNNSSIIIQRTMTNASGGNVTVKAIAIYTNPVAGGIMYYLDSVTPDDVIANGQTYTVNITFQITT